MAVLVWLLRHPHPDYRVGGRRVVQVEEDVGAKLVAKGEALAWGPDMRSQLAAIQARERAAASGAAPAAEAEQAPPPKRRGRPPKIMRQGDVGGEADNGDNDDNGDDGA